MQLNRRGFLKVGGLVTLGLLAKPAIDVFSRGQIVKAASTDAPPLVGKRWAMVVNTALCQDGCTQCIAACDDVHNIPDFGSDEKDAIKWIFKLPYDGAFDAQPDAIVQKKLANTPILCLCNQCNNPPCVRVCPTQATFRRSDGIVMQDYHRCIGCRYCMAACPYGSRSFNWRDPRPFIKNVNPDYPTRTRGVVEKCDFCEERLAIGQLPACVEACPTKALTFGDLDAPDSKIRALLEANYSIQRKPELGTQPQVYYLV